jgi:hypothetical protein
MNETITAYCPIRKKTFTWTHYPKDILQLIKREGLTLIKNEKERKY